jgi:hypothetical protein
MEHLAQFDKDWQNALPCDDYAVVQISPRKWLVMKDTTGAGKGLVGDMRLPRKYVVVVTCSNQYTAYGYIRGLIRQTREGEGKHD